MAARIHGLCIDSRRAAGREDDVLRREQGQARRAAAAQVERQQTLYRTVLRQQANGLHPVENADALARNAALERLGHESGGQRACRSRTLARVVVGLVADILAVLVGRERHAEIRQLHKGAERTGRLGQRGVAVDTAAGEQRFRHLLHGIRAVGGDGQLVIGLLVAAGVARCADVHALGEDGDVLSAEVVQPVGGVVARTARADHQRIERDDRYLAACKGQLCFQHSASLSLTGGGCGSRRPRSGSGRWQSPDGR